MRRLRWLVVASLFGLFLAGLLPDRGWSAAGAQTVVAAQADVTQRLNELKARVDRLESRLDKSAGAAVAFLFGAFCALWAQNTKRNPWAWFFIGLFFNVIAVLVLLSKNADDRKTAEGTPIEGSTNSILAALLGILLIIVFFLLIFWRNA